MLAILTTLANNVFLFVGSFVFGIGAILTAWIPPRGLWPYRCALAWSRGLLLSGGVTVEVRSETDLSGGPFVFLANHQSLFDIPVLISVLPESTRLLAKRSLFRIPVFGWALHVAGFVPVDRSDLSRAKRAVSGGVRQLREGRSLLLFPEETRSLDGRIRPFKRGGVLLAQRQSVALVPIGVAGTRAVRRKGSWIVRPPPPGRGR